MEAAEQPKAGNRGKGRPKGSVNKASAELKKYAQKFTKRAIDRLVYLMDNAENEQTQAFASDKLLDRAHGKPQQAVEHTGSEKEPIRVVITATPQKVAEAVKPEW